MKLVQRKVKARSIQKDDVLYIAGKLYRVTDNLTGYIGPARRHIQLIKINSEHLEDRMSIMVASTEKFRIDRPTPKK